MRPTQIDNIPITKTGQFEVSTTLPPHPGFYRLQFNSNDYTDIILTPNDKTTLYFEGCTLKKWKKIKGSRENQLLKQSKDIASGTEKSNSMKLISELAEKNKSTYFGITTRAYVSIEHELPDTFVSTSKAKYCAQHYFDKTDFSQTGLLYSTVLPNIYMRYFERYTQYDEEGFKHAVDYILKNAAVNADIHAFTLEFLMELFSNVGPEIIFEYIIEHHLTDTYCVDQSTATAQTAERIKKYLQLRQGNSLATIPLPIPGSIDSSTIQEVCKLHKLTMLIFWSSYCHFCQNKSTEWVQIQQDFSSKGLQIVYFSLDTDSTEWKKSLVEKKLQGIHSCDFKGWKSPVVENLMVNKTPFIILLNADGTILLKDPTNEQLRTFISNYLK